MAIAESPALSPHLARLGGSTDRRVLLYLDVTGQAITNMFNLTCVDSFRYPGHEDVYVTDLVPLTQGPATISSDQKLCLFNPLSLRPGPTQTLQTNHGNLTCAKAYDLGGSVVATAGEDGSISMWDLRLDGKQAQVARMTGV